MAFFYFILFIFGVLFGSFANAWIWRLRQGIPISQGRSRCPNCRQQISWRDNIPLISFLLLRGRCRRCQTKISWQYPVVEILMGLFFLAVSYFFADNYWLLGVNLFITFFLFCVFVYDAKYYEIPDSFSLLPVPFLFAFNVLVLRLSWWDVLVNIGLGSGFFLLQYIFSKGKWIGGGDVRLGILIGLALPNQYLILAALFLAYVSGAAVGVALLLQKKKGLKSELPFGTFLSAATFAVLVLSEPILQFLTRFMVNF